MPTDTRTLSGTFTLDSDFRSWGSGLNAQIAAVGLVKTSDTGQIDWTTTLKPSAGTQKVGYEIWRFNDALQATKPVFIRIDYGSSSAGISFPGLWVTVGTSTNGAGTLTGQVGATKQVYSSSAGTVSYCSGSSSRLNLVTSVSTLTSIMVICVERTKTGAGVDTGDAIVRYAFSSAVAAGFQVVPFAGTISADAGASTSLDMNLGGASSIGTDVMLSPTTIFFGKPLFVSWCIYKSTEIAGLVAITFTHLGATRTYMPMGATSVFAPNNIQNSGGYALAMLWE